MEGYFTSHHKNAVIIGAGRIGRGMMAEAFLSAGYDVAFVDVNERLISMLKERGSYTHIKSVDGQLEYRSVSEYSAVSLTYTGLVTDLLCAPNAICAICVPADALADTAPVLALAIARRAMEQARNPLNVFLCVNTLKPAAQMRAHMESMLGGAALDYMRAMVGFVDTVVLRVAPAVPAHYLEDDPLTVLDSGYPYLIADRFGYKGDWRISDKIIFSDNIAAEDMKRIYTLNMAHATLAYMGAVYGYSRLLDALHDARIYQCLQGALAESAEGLRHAFSLPREDTEAWSREVLHMLEDPYLDGPLSALGADSARKLAVNDRLVGPAMLCLRAGKKPDNLVRVTAAGYLFSQSDDPGTTKTLDIVHRSGIATAIEVISGIDLKHPLRNAALEAYYQAKDIMEGNINEN